MKKSKKLVLVVDDNEDQRDFFEHLVARFGLGYLGVGSGAQAIEIFKNRGNEISAVILDVRLQGENGFDVLEQLSAAGCNVGVIFMSGDTELWPRGRPMRMPPHPFLHKPFYPQELSDALKQVGSLPLPQD